MRAIDLKKHRLTHIPELRVDTKIFYPSYGVSCSMRNCDASCCRDGVFLDPAEKQNILSHADLVIHHMDPHQEKDPRMWFEPGTREDDDFPSRVCTGTRAVDSGCVFLNAKGACVLQKAAEASGRDKYALKPYFCVAYPLTIQDGVLTVEDGSFTDRPDCCTPDEGPVHAPADICREELEFMLGNEGLSECDRIRTTLDQS